MRALNIIPVFFLVGSVLLLILTIINGAGTSSVLGKFYWSETDTSGLTGVPYNKTRWTFYRMCGVDHNKNAHCGKSQAAFPYSPEDNFGRNSGIPQNFIDDRDTYYYLSRVGWAFILVGLFFGVAAMVAAPLNFCYFVAGIVGLTTAFVSLLFTITAACCITAAHTKGRREWNRAGFPTVLGAKAFGILWTAVACLLISFVSLVVLTCLSRTSTRRRNRGVGVTNGSEVTPRGEQETYAKENSGEIPRGEYESGNHPVTGPGEGERLSNALKFRFFRVKRAKSEDV